MDSDGNVTAEPDLLTWARAFEKMDRRIAADEAGPSKVSTVFLGVDHQWGDGPPLIFETLVFGGPLEGEMDRYSTRAEALAGHAAMLARVKASLN